MAKNKKPETKQPAQRGNPDAPLKSEATIMANMDQDLRRLALASLVEQAHDLAEGLKDGETLKKPQETSEILASMPLSEKDALDLEGELKGMVFGLQERATKALETSSLSEAEREPLVQVEDVVGRIGEPPAGYEPTMSDPERQGAINQDAAKRIAGRYGVVTDEALVAEKLRGLALPGESLVQAVERLEALAETGRYFLNKLGAEKPGRIAGVLVHDVENERHVVSVIEGEGGELNVWALEKGAPMPWHAAEKEVLRMVETKLTPEDKR